MYFFRNDPKITKFVLIGYTLLKQKQKTFNIDNGLRVHQRGGTMDSVLYNTTVAFLLIGGVLWVKNVFTMSFPQKN